MELQQKAERLGYDPPSQIGSGNSQTYEFRVKKHPVLLLAFRDLGLKPGYATPNRLWAEGLDLVLNRYQTLAAATPKVTLPQAIALVIDNIGGHYVIVSMNELLELYLERRKTPKAEGSRQLTFMIERRDSSYCLLMPNDIPPVALVHVDSMDPIVQLLKRLRFGQK